MKQTDYNFYLNENNKNIKQSFVDIANKIEMEDFVSIADVGCATGAFPNYLKDRFPTAEITGIEYLDKLLIKARNDFPNISFMKGNALDKHSIDQTFDVITMLGVLAIFDDYNLVLRNMLSWLKPKGRLVLHTMVSDYDIDVFIKYKPSSCESELGNLESGWNILSKKSIGLVADQNGAKMVSCEPFSLGVKLNKQSDVMRSWTEENTSGGNDIYNALNVRQPIKIVVIEKF
jgi:ubiquinone/menaquinone biosynthesis C-methylase UbiE